MACAQLTTHASCGVTLLGDSTCPSRVRFAFTERTGGVSEGAYASLNLGDSCGDDASAVGENRRRALEALGASSCAARLVNPRQVHGDHVVVVRDAAVEAVARARQEAREGADAVVCTAADVPVLLCFADCVPVVLVADVGFAVVHSGWKGTIARIAAKALCALVAETGTPAAEVRAYIGPHVGAADYEVSAELAARFAEAFGAEVCPDGVHLDLGLSVRLALEEAGAASANICCCDVSTASATGRFFSYRASGGHCGRHGALAVLPGPLCEEV